MFILENIIMAFILFEDKCMIAPKKKPVNYLSNTELLKEIHASKRTYCYMDKPEYFDYDGFIVDLELPSDEIIQNAKQCRFKRLSVNNPDLKLENINLDDLIFRRMTHEHLPLVSIVRKTKGPTIKPAKVNFPPFKHYQFRDGLAVEVGRSHYREQEFCISHGKMTNNLINAFILLTEKIGLQPNYRNYTYLDEMKSQACFQLSQVGLQFDESKGQNPFAYYTSVVYASFTKILNSEKDNQMIRDDLLIAIGANPSSTRQIENELDQREDYDDKHYRKLAAIYRKKINTKKKQEQSGTQ